MAALEAKLEAALKGDTEKPEPRKPRTRRGAGETEEQKLGTQAEALKILAEEPGH